MRPGGYAWWYVDALSDDGRYGITLIALIGSVFSPYYAHARRSGLPDPEQYVALNVALYKPGGKRWSMTERGANALERGPENIRIGPSSLRWDSDTLIVDIAETTVPWPSGLRGQVRLHAPWLSPTSFNLDRDGLHRWRPIAPRARIEVDMRQPAMRWQGNAYFDCNQGDEALEARFRRWDWSRAMLANGCSAVLYHALPIDQSQKQSLALHFTPQGNISYFHPPADQPLPRSAIWRIERASQCEPDISPTVHKTLEDTPFYARSIINTKLLGEKVVAVHESLSLTRFDRTWVKLLLPFRMPRRRHWAD